MTNQERHEQLLAKLQARAEKTQVKSVDTLLNNQPKYQVKYSDEQAKYRYQSTFEEQMSVPSTKKVVAGKRPSTERLMNLAIARAKAKQGLK